MPATLEKPKKTAVKSADYSALFWVLLSYQTPMKLREKVLYRTQFQKHSYYYVYNCPRCEIPIDREFQKYCDRCGQKLDWIGYQKAKLIKRWD